MVYRVRSWKHTRKAGKYKNLPRDYKGIQYHSIKEAKYARDLDLRVRAKEIKGWQRQVKVELHGAGGGHVCDYYVDFCVEHNDGTTEWVEVKGFETPEWRLKWKLFVDEMKDSSDMLTVVR